MKLTYHIPTEQYGFLEIEVDNAEEIPPYEELKARAVGKAGEGMADLEFNRVLDKYMKEHTMLAEEYEMMDYKQQGIIQCLKKAYKRQNNDK